MVVAENTIVSSTTFRPNEGDTGGSFKAAARESHRIILFHALSIIAVFKSVPCFKVRQVRG